MLKKRMPTDALVAVTYNCNAKCSMCNIWKENQPDVLTSDDFRRLPKTLKDINITGGEPFLRKDIVEISRVITEENQNVRLVFSSNGFLTGRIVDAMQRIEAFNPRTGIGLSVDGIGEMHDKIRGVNGAYEKVLRTVEGLQNAGLNNIRLAFTASADNVSHLEDVYNLARTLGVEFTLAVVHNAGNYFDIEDNIEPDLNLLKRQMIPVLTKEYKSLNPRKLLRAYFMEGLLDYVRNKKRMLPCNALDSFFFLDPMGDVYPCNILTKSVGNILQKSFDEIWQDDSIDDYRSFCEQCNDCWMVCTAKGSIRKRLPQTSMELVKRKLFFKRN